MSRRRYLCSAAIVATSLLALIPLSACGPGDPCGGKSGACLALRVEGEGVDVVRVRLEGAVDFADEHDLGGAGQELPVTFAILLPDATGTIFARGVGLAGGQTTSVGSVSVEAAPGAHLQATLRLSPATASCSDRYHDGDESDVDCGGTCPKCLDGSDCKVPSDCESDTCTTGICGTGGLCQDNKKNGTETDVDCGGNTCGPCADGKGCGGPNDCASGVCTGNLCAGASCSDKKQNGAETDVDCGASCPKCAALRNCKVDSDCLSGRCVDETCAAPTCDDMVKNGGESDVDCGGTCPSHCADGKACMDGGDCTSGVCTGGICAKPTCIDKVHNGAETDIDCGGACLTKCAAGRACKVNADCQSMLCAMGVCTSPGCTDMVKNGTETDIDCGGSACPKCGTSRTCSAGGDCQSLVCSMGKCAAPTCTDMVKNGTETDIDCAGTCAKCADGRACVAAVNCLSGVCTAGKCAAATCTDNVKNGKESDVDCGGGTCAKCAAGRLCTVAADCASGVCTLGRCVNVKLVFVTERAWSGNLGGALGADQKCMADVRRPNTSTYKALLTDGKSRIASKGANLGDGQLDWVLRPSTIYRRTDGATVMITSSRSIFVFGTLTSPLSSVTGGRYWSGLLPDWTTAAGTCAAWASQSSLVLGTRGALDSTAATAISNETNGLACSGLATLVCVEQ